MLDAGEQPGWVAKMMGHTNLKMIHERYGSDIKNYQRDDGAAFMANVYGSESRPAVSYRNSVSEASVQAVGGKK